VGCFAGKGPLKHARIGQPRSNMSYQLNHPGRPMPSGDTIELIESSYDIYMPVSDDQSQAF
jgi:hypothetical protein